MPFKAWWRDFQFLLRSINYSTFIILYTSDSVLVRYASCKRAVPAVPMPVGPEISFYHIKIVNRLIVQCFISKFQYVVTKLGIRNQLISPLINLFTIENVKYHSPDIQLNIHACFL